MELSYEPIVFLIALFLTIVMIEWSTRLFGGRAVVLTFAMVVGFATMGVGLNRLFDFCPEQPVLYGIGASQKELDEWKRRQISWEARHSARNRVSGWPLLLGGFAMGTIGLIGLTGGAMRHDEARD
jgi:hypothetical protein